MPLTGDFVGLRRLAADVKKLASGEIVLNAAKAEVKGLLREQFQQGIGPDGAPLQETKRGKAALVSRKLQNVFQGRIDHGALRFVGKSKRDMLTGHQEGVTFPARGVAANKQYLTYDKNGRLVKRTRATNKLGAARRGYYQTFAKAHRVGERRLPVRKIAPEGNSLPSRYEERIEKRVSTDLNAWGQKRGAK